MIGLGIIQERNSRSISLDLWEFLKVTVNLAAKSAVAGGG